MKLISHKIQKVVETFGKRSTGISTGLSGLDTVIRGLRGGNLILIGGRPSMGKTSLMSSIALHVGRTDPVLIVSLEMPFQELQERAVCSLAQLNYHRILSGFYPPEDQKKLDDASVELAKRKVYVVDGSWKVYPSWVKDRETGGVMADSMMDVIYEAIEKHKIKVVLIDHLQYVSTPFLKADSESLRLHFITETLHYLSVEKDIPVVLCSQLRRFDQERQKSNPKPNMDDIRNSGSVEEDCNIVCLLHRPEYYEKKAAIDLYSNPVENNAEIIVAKNRGGPTGIVPVTFNAYCMSFTDNEESLWGS